MLDASPNGFYPEIGWPSLARTIVLRPMISVRFIESSRQRPLLEQHLRLLRHRLRRLLLLTRGRPTRFGSCRGIWNARVTVFLNFRIRR